MWHYLLVMAYHMDLCINASIVRIWSCLYLSGNFISSICALETHRENIAFVHADLPVELYVIVSVVQMFYFHISGHRIIPLLLALFFLCLCWSFNCEFFQCFTA